MAESLVDFPARDCSTTTHNQCVDFEQRRLQLLAFLKKEISNVRTTIDSFNKGTVPSLDKQTPYIAELLSAFNSTMQIKVCGTSQSGETTKEFSVSLNQAPGDTADPGHHEEMLGWAQLVNYLLHTRGRLIKNKEELKLHVPGGMRLSEPFEATGEKAEYLATSDELRECKKLKSLTCNSDPDWSLRVLQIVAPHIEYLKMSHPGPAHLQILGRMPKLRRLEIWSYDHRIACDDFGPFRWPDKGDALGSKFTYDLQDPSTAWQFEDVPLSNVGLVWLQIWLPRHIALPLIAQHSRTLRYLSLEVGLPPEQPPSDFYESNWSWGSTDLPERLGELVERYQFPALRNIQLYRISKHGRSYHLCQQQLQAVRKALAKNLGTRVAVICNSCG